MTERSLTVPAEKLEYVRSSYLDITSRIARAAEASGRKAEDITLLAATKTVEPEVINYAVSLGLRYIGENKVQELLSKYEYYDLEHCDLQFIGHLQTNKVRQIVGKVSMIQSVDSFKLAGEISKQSAKNGITTDVLIAGVMPEELEELIAQSAALDSIRIRGLMAVPPICDKKAEICNFFDKMHHLFIDISDKTLDNVSMDFLSMGMSDDFEEAILSGANMVRVGSRLFGARIYR